MLPRLVATDLDGTLLRDDATVAPRTRRALDAVRARGTEVVVCTARPARWMAGLARAAGIEGPVVCTNGAVVWDLAAARALETFLIDPADALEAVARLRAAVPGATWAVEGVDSFGHEPAYEPRWPVPDDTVVDHIEALLAPGAPAKLLLRAPAPGPDALARSADAAVAGLVQVTTSTSAEPLLEISAAGVSKRAGLAALCERRGIAAADVIAFGDMPNDLEMLRWAGHGVAMANGHPDVLAAADEVCAGNESDGVAAVLERLLDEDGARA